jgi:acetyl esterase
MSTQRKQSSAVHNVQRSTFLGNSLTESLRPGPGLPRMMRADEPDRDARAFLRMVNLAPNSARSRVTLQGLRQSARLSALALGSRPGVASVHEQSIIGPAGPILLRVFNPGTGSGPLPALVWYFGGGFVVGDLDTADSICRNVALVSGCITVAVRYRLAPEHDIVASRDDAMAALQWIAENGAELGIDTTRLAVGGDSAGGNLAAAVAQECKRRGGPALKAQVLVYPATDLMGRFPSYEQNIHGDYLLTAEAIQMLEGYLTHSIETLDLSTPWLSPRRYADLGGLPPAVIVSAGFDPIRDDGLDYGLGLRVAGVPVESLHYPGQFHGFLNFDTVLGASRDALQRIGEALAAIFNGEPAHDRTFEVADADANCHWPLGRTAIEVASYTLTAWVAAEGWTRAVLRLLAPTAGATCGRLLKPLLIPVAHTRRLISEHLSQMTSEQTYPVSTPKS